MLPAADDERFQELGAEGFCFACHPGVPCFNQCCRRLNLVLTPYDVLRLKQRLGLGSGEFIERYTKVATGQNGWPLPSLAMQGDAEGTCPFLTDQGCGVYPDRPGACRTYPLGRATKGGAAGGPQEESWFLVREAHCRGFDEGPRWTPQAWTQDQGLAAYHAANDMFLPIVTRQAPAADAAQAQKKMQMFFMACYNLDAFKDFVRGSRLAQVIDLDPTRLELIQSNELQLLKFAFDWLRFSLFGEPTLTLRRA
ncbi:MAG: YkgJ family cysteine cluster protein [Thermodesulfobacteriota bacterium]